MQFLSRVLIASLLLTTTFFASAAAQNLEDYSNAYDYHRPRMEWWSSAKVGIDLNSKWDLSLKMINRFGSSFTTWGGNFYYAQLRYNYKSVIYPDFQIRYVDGPSGKLWRYEAGIQFRFHLKDWTFYYRTAYFNEYPYLIRNYNPNLESVNYWRNRIGIRKNISKRIKTEFSFETYTQLLQDGIWVKRIASIGSIDYSLSKYATLNFFYINQPDYHKTNLVWLSGFCIGYSYQLPDILQKKKSKKDRQHFLEEEQ